MKGCFSPLLLLLTTGIFAAKPKQLGCKSVKCASNELCLMKSQSCTSPTCPDMPTCVPSSSVCGEGAPFSDEYDGVAKCSDSKSCLPGFVCTDGYCCIHSPETIMPEDGGLPNFLNIDNDFIPPVEKSPDHQSISNGCKPCPYLPCMTAVCVYPEETECVVENCSCIFWFRDSKGRPVTCGVPIDGVAPPIFEIPTSTKLSAKYTSTKPSKEVKTLQTSDEPKSNDDILLYVICTFGVVLLVGVVGFAIHRVWYAKRHGTDSGSTDENMEQKMPLKEFNSHNNNEIKHSNPPTNAASGKGYVV